MDAFHKSIAYAKGLVARDDWEWSPGMLTHRLVNGDKQWGATKRLTSRDYSAEPILPPDIHHRLPVLGDPVTRLIIDVTMDDIVGKVQADLHVRRGLGLMKYGHLLEIDDGRDWLTEAYEESMDQCIYLRAAIEKRGAEEGGTP